MSENSWLQNSIEKFLVDMATKHAAIANPWKNVYATCDVGCENVQSSYYAPLHKTSKVFNSFTSHEALMIFINESGK